MFDGLIELNHLALNPSPDVAESIKDIAIHIDARLTIDERSLLSVAYKMKSNSLRTALRLTTKLSNAPSNTPRQVKLGEAECKRIERELAIVCEDVVALLKTRLMPGAADHGEERVFLLKMSVACRIYVVIRV